MSDDLPRELITRPQVRLHGQVNPDWIDRFLDQLGKVSDEDEAVAFEVTTQGGDPDIARRLVLELDLARERSNRRMVFIGKTEIYSAGVTFMAAFPKEDRYITGDSVLLVHCRQLQKTVELSGPLRSSLPQVQALQKQIEVGLQLEEENFCRLIEGSEVELSEVLERGLYNWYITAEEALDRGLVQGVIPARR